MSMVICKKCGNLTSYNSYFGKYYCSVCGEYFDNNTITNADHIRNMTDKELAVEIAYWADNGDDPKELVNEIFDYLKQPYKAD